MAALLLASHPGPPAHAQGVAAPASPCPLSYDHYRGFIVRQITVAPLLPSLHRRATLDDALAAARGNLGAARPGLEVGEPFTPSELSVLQAELSEELRRRRLSETTGFSLVTPELRNCRDADPTPTLDVEYRVLTLARPTYLTTSFEARDLPGWERRLAGERGQGRLVVRPYAGYDDSRGLYGGSRLALRGDHALVEALDLDLSASGNSSVADAALTGSREFPAGLLDFAEWRLGYAHSDVPADRLRLRGETFLAQIFAASRAFEPGALIIRAGTSLEGGRRESNVRQADLPAETVADSDYAAGKLYLGTSLARGPHEWKVSYGLQLGSTGDRVGLDYHRQVLDSAYRLRLVPRPHLPFQLDAQVTAGLLGSLDGNVPAGERFFGGNVERTFIQGDTWRIRSNPVIRSFAQNRFNDAGGRPVGGDRFAALNLTLAQTVWSRPLLPREVARVLVRDPDVTGALGGQLVTARLVLREGEIQRASPEFGTLKAAVGGLEKTLARLEAALTALPAMPDVASDVAALREQLAAVRETVASAQPADDQAAPITTLAEAVSNVVETAALTLVRGDREAELDPQLPPLGTALLALHDRLVAGGRADPARPLADGARELQAAGTAIEQALQKVEQLRAYAGTDLATMLDRLATSDPRTGRNLSQALTSLRQELAPIAQTRQATLRALATTGHDAQTTAAWTRLQECVDLLTAADVYATRAAADVQAAIEHLDKGRSSDAKNILEQVVVGFGGVPSQLAALVGAVGELEGPCQGPDLAARWPAVQEAAREVRALREGAAAGFARLAVPRYEAAANRTLGYVGRVLDVFVNELNLVAVSPVLMLDVAKLRTARRAADDDPRYGIGLGLRLSLVNVDFTAGYSLNPDRHRGEAPGAFVFTLTINDLFR